MCLKYIKVWNFGVHKKAEVQFTESGLIVVRGRNGAGKSTLVIQATLYGMFGISAVDGQIEDFIPIGTKDNPKVEVGYKDYVVKRTKSSASVIGPDVKISGQNNVSEFFYDLFGLMKGTEGNVLIAKQRQTPGILNGKPSELSEFIEKTAGFYHLDEIIARIREEYPTGSKKALEEMLQEKELELKGVELTETPNTDSMKSQIAECEEKISSLNDEISVLSENITESTSTKTELEKALIRRNNLLSTISNLKSRVNVKTGDLSTIRGRLEGIHLYSDAEVREAESLSKLSEKRKADRRVWRKVKDIREIEDVWEGDEDSFIKELRAVTDEVQKEWKDINYLHSDIVRKKARLEDPYKPCPTCGAIPKNADEMAAENERVREEIASLETELELMQQEVKGKQEYLAVLKEIDDEHRSRKSSVCHGHDKVKITMTTIPYEYVYTGEEPILISREELRRANDICAHNIAAKAEMKELNRQITSLEDEISSLQKELDDKVHEIESSYPVDPVEISSLDDKIKLLSEKIDPLKEVKKQMSNTLTGLNTELIKAEKETKSKKEKITYLNEYMKGLRKRIKEDNRNGRIHKEVRDTRNRVIETVWGKVLSVVETVYTSIIGEEVSIVKDEKKGFIINGVPVKRLSGSEETMLGLALRIAIRDIFAPGCEFIMFDEPFADCDRERTISGIAALKGVSGQRVVITHEDLSETVADQFIKIGE